MSKEVTYTIEFSEPVSFEIESIIRNAAQSDMITISLQFDDELAYITVKANKYAIQVYEDKLLTQFRKQEIDANIISMEI